MKKNSGKVYVLLDVSGSMMSGQDAENLMHGMGLVDQLATALRLEVCVIQCDTDVTKVMTTQEALEEVRAMKFEVKGQGGSNLEPAFEHIWKEMMIENGNRGNAIICFTDGVIHVPEEVPPGLRQQCMWVTNPGQSAPTKNWGEHVIMRDL
jgi:predicted metal-dependent peptidase